ncbi:MAG: CDP-alcohol phosphatidyltransferase family protein [Acidobacteria bacterium]|nr:CDP-alcohol phosphatidyltransferase family protein [Acidobacteriota bacterium]
MARRTRPRKDLRDLKIVREIAAQPGPRDTKGLVAPTLARALAWPYRAVLRGLLALRVTGDQLTLLSVVTNVAAGVTLARGERLLPGLLLIPAGLLDIFDGAVARARGTSGARGAWLDSTGDRVSEAAVLGGLFLSLAAQGRDLEAALCLAALVVSLTVSFSRAQAQALGAQMGEGIFSRLERTVALILGLIVPKGLVFALGALVALGAVTLCQRLVQARRALARERP